MALGYSLIKNHPLIDGNKRVGFEAMRLMLRLNEYDLKASERKKFDFVVAVAEGKMNERKMTERLKKYSKHHKF